MSLTPGLGSSPGEGNGNPLPHSCLGNPVDRGVWQATVHGVTRVGHDLATEQEQQLGLGVEDGEEGGFIIKAYLVTRQDSFYHQKSSKIGPFWLWVSGQVRRVDNSQIQRS